MGCIMFWLHSVTHRRNVIEIVGFVLVGSVGVFIFCGIDVVRVLMNPLVQRIVSTPLITDFSLFLYI